MARGQPAPRGQSPLVRRGRARPHVWRTQAPLCHFAPVSLQLDQPLREGPESSKQVWSAREGYPGDPAYRDFYRDIGMELPEDYLRTVLPDMGCRRNTGFKYHRITGSPDKQLYNRAWAMAAADHHAGDFMNARIRQFRNISSRCCRSNRSY
jgi:predicted glycosyl hydrolase (DUF1957 family)